MERTRSHRKVLVVDDEAEVLRSVHDLLRIDYQVLTCQSGRGSARSPQGRPRCRRDPLRPENARNVGRRGPPPGPVDPPRNHAAPVHCISPTSMPSSMQSIKGMSFATSPSPGSPKSWNR